MERATCGCNDTPHVPGIRPEAGREICPYRQLLERTCLEDPTAVAMMAQQIVHGIEQDGSSFMGSREETIDVLDTMGHSCGPPYRCGTNVPALELSILCLRQADLLSDGGDSRTVIRLLYLGRLLLDRLKILGSVSDADLAIAYLAKAAEVKPGVDDTHIWVVHELSTAHLVRFQRSGELRHIDLAICCQEHATTLAGDKHKDYPGFLGHLGTLHGIKYDELRDMDSIQSAILFQARAVQIAPEGHDILPGCLSNLGNSYLSRFKRLGEMEDLNAAVSCHAESVQLAPEGHTDRSIFIRNSACSYLHRYKRVGDIEDLNRALEPNLPVIQLTPEGLESSYFAFSNLGASYMSQFIRLGWMEDLGRAIECYKQAIQLVQKEDIALPMLITKLAELYQCRFNRLAKLEDINQAIDLYTKAAQLTPEGRTSPHRVLAGLGVCYKCRFKHLGEMADINMAIECLTRELQLAPEGLADAHVDYDSLGTSYRLRFQRLGLMEDISKAIECQTRAVHLIPKGHLARPSWIGNLGNSYIQRYGRLRETEDIHNAIEYLTQAMLLTPEGHPDKASFLHDLGRCYNHRSSSSVGDEDTYKAVECLTQAVQLTAEGHPSKPTRLHSLSSTLYIQFHQIGNIDAIDNAVVYIAESIALTPSGHSEMPHRFNTFGNLLRERFSYRGHLVDLDRAIEAQTQALNLLPQASVDIVLLHYNLGMSYRMRLGYSRYSSDLILALEHLGTAACSTIGAPVVRFQASTAWAELLSIGGSSASLSAYQVAMMLLPEVVWLGTTFGRRYESTHEVGEVVIKAAAAAISANELELALEWLEAGRSIVWNQISQLRMPFDDLGQVDPVLAGNLQRISGELEQAITRMPSLMPFQSETMVVEQTTIQHHRLVDEFNSLVSQARDLPGFHDFMRPKKAAVLKAAARSGPVVVVTVHPRRCDALVIHAQSDIVEHMPLPDLSSDEIKELQRKMQQSLESKSVRERKFHKPEQGGCDHFAHVLAALWFKLVKPVLNYLGYTEKLTLDKLPHITWCTTGALSFLPIHAAGCYGSQGDHIFDYAITSYAPTLSVLLPPGFDSPAKLGGILAVSQEFTPGCSDLPGTKHELARIKQHVKGLPYMQLDNSDATPAAVLAAVEKYECVHLACHASQHPVNPRESCFHLSGGTLSLAEIAQKSLKSKGLAFLSACQTAAGNENLPDEAVHLAAGMLVAGYPSVIATMWSINDHDAPLVADEVYGQLIQDGKLESNKSARALHSAIAALRADIGEKMFHRWVPYIHMGV